jgi:hemerythrin-like domain-containing protein
MDAIRVLSDDHRTIQRMLNVLEALAGRARGERRIDITATCESVVFFREYADRWHHGREEEILFRFLVHRRGLSPEYGPTAMLRQEHIQSRICIRGIEDTIRKYCEGHAQALDCFLEFATTFVRIQRGHIRKEDRTFYPRFMGLLTPDDHREILSAYGTADRRIWPQTPGVLQGVAARLADRYPAAVDSVPP